MRLPVLALLIAIPTVAQATDCPQGAPSCKVITLTPDEEKVLVDQRGILDTAAQARQLDLANLVAYFRQKIATAPQGTVTKAPEPARQEAVPTPTPDKPLHVPVPTPDPRK